MTNEEGDFGKWVDPDEKFEGETWVQWYARKAAKKAAMEPPKPPPTEGDFGTWDGEETPEEIAERRKNDPKAFVPIDPLNLPEWDGEETEAQKAVRAAEKKAKEIPGLVLSEGSFGKWTEDDCR